MVEGPILRLVLVDSELEIVPGEHWSHPAVVQNARKRKKRPSRVLLDSSLHHSVFSDPEEKNRRGRPDIAHQFMLLCLDSIPNQEGRLSLHVHTRNDEVIYVDPRTRLPKNYNRFSGLMEELFRSGAVPTKNHPLLRIKRNTGYSELISELGKNAKIAGRGFCSVALDISGRPGSMIDVLREVFDTETNIDVVVSVGGFSSGGYRSDVLGSADIIVSIYPELLKVWTVVSEVLVSFHYVSSGSRGTGSAVQNGIP